jgi:ABC-type multidrug transport system ATPase subunit
MKQRFAVGATLLRDPDVVVLDEPANGLDPAGIVEIRQLMRDLTARGETVFVSSRQLGEVEQTADVLTIISNGRFIENGSVADVIQSAATSGRLMRPPVHSRMPSFNSPPRKNGAKHDPPHHYRVPSVLESASRLDHDENRAGGRAPGVRYLLHQHRGRRANEPRCCRHRPTADR